MAGSHELSRREFITLTTAAVGTVIAAVVGLPAIAYLLSPALKKVSTDVWIPLGKLSGFPVGVPTLVTFNRSQTNGWEQTTDSYGVFVLRKSESQVVVYSNVCTHLGCHVNWDTQQKEFICPCHDGRFNIDGQVIKEPPPRPLDRYTTKVEADTLSIHLLEG